MPVRTKARNQDELIALINEALLEVKDLRAAIEHGGEFMDEASIIVTPLSQGLNRLLTAINDGQYQIGQGDWLDFILVLKDIDHRAVPCWPVLKLIADTHQDGFQQASATD
jgi:hypothetical protein